MQTQLGVGVRVEREHSKTLDYIKRFYRKHHCFPSKQAIYRHIAQDHLREDKKYYSKLKKAKL